MINMRQASYGDYTNEKMDRLISQVLLDKDKRDSVYQTKLIDGIAVDIDSIISLYGISAVPLDDSDEKVERRKDRIYYDPSMDEYSQKMIKMIGFIDCILPIKHPFSAEDRKYLWMISVELLLPDKLLFKALHDVLRIGDGEHIDPKEKRREYGFADGGYDSSVHKMAQYLELPYDTVISKLRQADYHVVDDNTLFLIEDDSDDENDDDYDEE